MEGGEDEDPFGSLIELCQITSSQELKLRNCPFALESQNFPDAVDSLPSQFSPILTPPEPPGIIMVSPPESDGEGEDEDEDADGVAIDKSTPQENEEFQTPPEHHNISTSSSQEEPQQLPRPIAAVYGKIGGSDDVETVAIDGGYAENEVNFDLGEKGENLGLSETEKLEGEIEGIEGVKSESKKSRVSESDLVEPVSKKIRVCEETLGSETQTICVDKTEDTEKLDDVEEEDELSYLDVDEIDEEIGLDDYKIVINVDSAEEETEVNDGVSENGEMKKNVEDVFDGENDCEGETEMVYCGCCGGVGNPAKEEEEEEGVGNSDGGENKLVINGDLAAVVYKDGIRENGNDGLRENGEEVSGFRSIEEIEKFKYKGRNGVDNPGKEKVIGLDSGGKSSSKNGDLVAEAASEEMVTNNGNDEVRRSSEGVLGCRNIEEIENFRYEGTGDGGNQYWKEVAQRKRELPLSLREKVDNVGGKERKISNVDVKNLSWKELLDAAAVVLGQVDDGSEEDVDILEAAKRKGMTFPRPRWI